MQDMCPYMNAGFSSRDSDILPNPGHPPLSEIGTVTWSLHDDCSLASSGCLICNQNTSTKYTLLFVTDGGQRLRINSSSPRNF